MSTINDSDHPKSATGMGNDFKEQSKMETLGEGIILDESKIDARADETIEDFEKWSKEKRGNTQHTAGPADGAPYAVVNNKKNGNVQTKDGTQELNTLVARLEEQSKPTPKPRIIEQVAPNDQGSTKRSAKTEPQESVKKPDGLVQKLKNVIIKAIKNLSAILPTSLYHNVKNTGGENSVSDNKALDKGAKQQDLISESIANPADKRSSTQPDSKYINKVAQERADNNQKGGIGI